MKQCKSGITFFASVAAAWLFLAPGGVAGAAPPEPPLEWLSGAEIDRMGVDRAGNLWTWTRSEDRIRLVAPSGARLAEGSSGGAREIDVAADWGVAGLVDEDRTLRVTSLAGGRRSEISLPEPAKEVAWIDASTVAVSPALSEHRVELWSLESSSRIGTLGVEEPIEPRPGAAVVRTVELRFDAQRGLLYTLGSFRGDLQVFTLAGQRVLSARVEPPDPGRFDAWLEELDREARVKGEVRRPAIRVFRLALDGEGTAWVVQGCGRGDEATVVGFPLEGEARKLSFSDPCCSQSLEIWSGHWIFYRLGLPGQVRCNSVAHPR